LHLLGAALFTSLSVEIAKLTGDTSTTRIAPTSCRELAFLARVSLCVNAAASSASPPPPQFSPKPPLAWCRGGLYRVSGIAALIVILTLTALIYVEDFLKLKCRYMLFRVTTGTAVDLVTEVHRIFSDLNVKLDNFQVSTAGEKHVLQFDADVTHRSRKRSFPP